MVTSSACLKKYGHPTNPSPWLVVWNVPDNLCRGKIPKRIYCNTDLIAPISLAFHNLIERGFVSELKTWDGCFNIRPMVVGSGNYSLHSWGVAIDVNAKDNPYNGPVSLSDGFVRCFTEAGFDWGGNFQRKDGMHFQIAKI